MKQYVLDTNLFVYLSDKKGDKDLNRASRYFWGKAREEFVNGEAVLLVPEEVRRELEVQSYTLSDKRNSKTTGFLELCQEVSPTNLSREIEHKIRQLTAYVRSKFREDIGREMKYGGVSDARILYTSYAEDAVLVTANIRDFMLYPLLFPQNEESLYDIKEAVYVTIPEEGYAKIHSDPYFQKLLQEFFELDQES